MRHCEALKKEQSRSKFRLKFRHCGGAKQREQSLGILDFYSRNSKI